VYKSMLYPHLKPPAFCCSSGVTSGFVAKVVFEPVRVPLAVDQNVYI
jgi:hypothetical protein